MKWYFLFAKWRQYSSGSGCRLNYDKTFNVYAENREQAEEIVKERFFKRIVKYFPEDVENLTIEDTMAAYHDERSAYVADPVKASEHYREMIDEETLLTCQLVEIRRILADIRKGITVYMTESKKRHQIIGGILWQAGDDEIAKVLELNIEKEVI